MTLPSAVSLAPGLHSTGIIKGRRRGKRTKRKKLRRGGMGGGGVDRRGGGGRRSHPHPRPWAAFSTLRTALTHPSA